MRIWGFIGGLAALATVSGGAWAQGENGSTAAETARKDPPRVDLILVGDGARSPVLGRKVASWFGAETAVSVSAKSTLEPNLVLAPSDHVGVRVWLWVRSPSAVRLFFSVEPALHAPTRYLVTDVPLDRGLDELGAEQLAQVVHFSALGLWQGNVESTPSEVESRLQENARAAVPTFGPRAERGRISFRLGVEGGFRGGISQGLFWRYGAGLGIFDWRPDRVLGVMAHFESAPSGNPQGAPSLELSATSLRLGVLYELHTAGLKHWWASFQFGPGVDFLSYRSPAAGGHITVPLVFATFGSRVELGPVTLFGGFNYAIALEGTRFRVRDFSGRVATVGPWIIQPGVLYGLYW